MGAASWGDRSKGSGCGVFASSGVFVCKSLASKAVAVSTHPADKRPARVYIYIYIYIHIHIHIHICTYIYIMYMYILGEAPGPAPRQLPVTTVRPSCLCAIHTNNTKY